MNWTKQLNAMGKNMINVIVEVRFGINNYCQIFYRIDPDDNSIQFNSLLFMCRANSYKANYSHSTVQIYITT
jgi:hypothetical protein